MKKLKRFFYWLRTHTYNRYHMLDMRNARNGYRWGWYDRSDLFIFANFALLVAFVEKEYPGHVDWDYEDNGTRAARDEFMALYKWWTIERKIERDACDAILATIYNGPLGAPVPPEEAAKAQAAEEAIEARDDEMLRRLLAVRGALWT